MGILLGYTEAVKQGDVKEKLRSLKYSEVSGTKPYIQKDIPFGVEDKGFQYNQINSRLTDVERFAKILTSKPGLKFQGNQALLQQVDQVGKLKKAASGGFKSLAKAVGKQALKTATTNIAKTASILAQVPVNGTGTHFLINIAPDTYLSDGASPSTGLGQFLRDQGIGGGVNGAKAALAGESIGTPILDTGGVQADTVLFGNEKETLLSRQQSLGAQKAVDSFKGLSNFQVPPLSSPTVNPIQLGASKLPDLSKKFLSKNKPSNVPNLSNDYTEYLGKEIVKGEAVGKDGISPLPKEVNTQVVKDREKTDSTSLRYKFENEGTTTVDTDTKTTLPKKEDPKYKGVDIQGNYLTNDLYIQTRLKLGDQGNKNSLGIDELNALAESTTELLGDKAVDIIPFEFNIFEPGNERFLYFRAHLDSLSDNYTGEWNGTKYVGRAEQFYTYQGFNRTLDFSFKIAAFSKRELIPLYRKLNYLVGATAPTYASNGEFMKGTLCAITLGDYITRQDGFLSQVNLTWNTDYPWEIDLEDENYPILPHILDVSIGFTPIHKFNVKSDLDLTNPGEKYIGGDNNFRPKDNREVNTVASRGLTPIPSPLPTATAPSIPKPRKLLTPSVEVGQGAFGGPFDQGDFVNVGG